MCPKPTTHQPGGEIREGALPPSLVARAAELQWLLTDVDGVLTDGHLHYGPHGEEWKSFDVKDGLGVKLARDAGLKVGILSSRSSAALKRRGEELGFDAVLTGEADKGAAFARFLERHRTSRQAVAYVGDDLPDLVVLSQAGLSFAPADAVAEVRRRVDRILTARGGRGALREVVELVLEARGEWEKTVARYLPAPPA